MEITLRRCPTCENNYLDDIDICPSCASVVETKQENVNGTGKIYSFTRVFVAPDKFKDDVPYYLAIIELDAGPRMMARLQMQEGDHVRIDAPVELVSTEKGYTFALK